MSARRIYNILAIILFYGLIIGGFIVFGENLETKIKILDIIAICLFFTPFVPFTILPLINLGDPAHKEVGMLGIHIPVLILCSALSLILIICGIIFEISFKFQLFGQLAILFILLIGIVATLHSGEKVQQIHAQEQNIKEGKVSLQLIMDDFSDYMATIRELDPVIVTKLNTMLESIRYITPSGNMNAKLFDSQFVQSIDDLKALLRDTDLNRDKIFDEVEHLERILARRKKY